MTLLAPNTLGFIGCLVLQACQLCFANFNHIKIAEERNRMQN